MDLHSAGCPARCACGGGETLVMGAKMKSVHASATASFALAFLFYFIAWAPGLWLFAVLGVMFEIGGWLFLWLGPDVEDLNPPR